MNAETKLTRLLEDARFFRQVWLTNATEWAAKLKEQDQYPDSVDGYFNGQLHVWNMVLGRLGEKQECPCSTCAFGREEKKTPSPDAHLGHEGVE